MASALICAQLYNSMSQVPTISYHAELLAKWKRRTKQFELLAKRLLDACFLESPADSLLLIKAPVTVCRFVSFVVS